MNEMSIGDVLSRAHLRQRFRSRRVSQEPMRTHPGDCVKRRHRILEARAVGRAQTDSEKTHLANRAGRERFGPAEPSAGSDIFGVRFPSARYQEIDIEQVTHGSCASSAVTLSVVITGALSAASRTGRPTVPCLSLAARCDWPRRINARPSSSISTWSPGLRLSALRRRAGITSCPLVESRDLLMIQSYTSYLAVPRGYTPASRTRSNFHNRETPFHVRKSAFPTRSHLFGRASRGPPPD